MTSFAAIISAARRDAGLTAAQFDYHLSRGTELGANAYQGLGNAIYDAAQREGITAADMTERHGAEIGALVAAAKAKSYSGWSTASAGPIRYAH